MSELMALIGLANEPTTTVTLPVLIPIINLIFSVTALCAWSVTIRRVLRAPSWPNRAGARIFFSAFLITLVIIVAGALNQMGVLPTPAWIVFGTGGRFVVALLGLILAADSGLIEAEHVGERRRRTN